MADLAVQGIGAISVGVYPTSPSAEVEYLLGHSRRRRAHRRGRGAARQGPRRATKPAAPAPHRRHRYPRRAPSPDDPMITTFADLEALGAQRPVADWAEHVGRLQPSDVAMIVYTSGTTGPPQGRDALARQPHGRDPLVQPGLHRHARRRDPLLPAAVPRRRTAELGDQRRQHRLRRELRRGRRVVRRGPARRPADALPRRSPGVGEDDGVGPDPHGRRQLAEAPALLGSGCDAASASPPAGCVASCARRTRSSPASATTCVFRSLRDKLGLRRVRLAISGAAPIAPKVLELLLGARRSGPRRLRPDREHRRSPR